jgi:hypothetical protein
VFDLEVINTYFLFLKRSRSEYDNLAAEVGAARWEDRMLNVAFKKFGVKCGTDSK